MFPTAFFLALVWKFPLPLAGYGHGLDSALMTPFAVLFYGVLTGGFVIVPALGVLCGAFAQSLCKDDIPKARILSVFLGSICALISGIFLNLLERLIGPW